LRDLLGKLHNQKIWYRPKSQLAYIGGWLLINLFGQR
jgi:hypothetical protein